MTKLYPGVKETIADLPGLKSTATTKGTPTTRVVLEKFGLLPILRPCAGHRWISLQARSRRYSCVP